MVILVPPKSYDAAFFQNDAQTQTSYGTVNFTFQSYGPYVVKEWSNNQKFFLIKIIIILIKIKLLINQLLKELLWKIMYLNLCLKRKKLTHYL